MGDIKLAPSGANLFEWKGSLPGPEGIVDLHSYWSISLNYRLFQEAFMKEAFLI
jgi:hypothetical protein